MSPDWAKLLDFPDSPPPIWEVRLPIEFDVLAASLDTVISQHNYAIVEVKLDMSIPGMLRYELVDVLNKPLGDIRVRRAAIRGSIIEVNAPPQPEPREMTPEEQAKVDAQQDRNEIYWTRRKIWETISYEQAIEHGKLQTLQRGFVKGIMNRLIEDLSKEIAQEDVDDKITPESDVKIPQNDDAPWKRISDKASDRKIVELYCLGKSLKEIAVTVHLSQKRVRNRLSELRKEYENLIPYRRQRPG